MTPRLSHILIGAALVIGLFGAVAFGVSHFAGKIESKAKTQSKVDEGKAQAHAEQAKASDAAAQNLKAELDATKADLDRLTAERGALLRKLATAKQNSGNQSIPPASAVAPPVAAVPVDDGRDAVIAKDAEVIESQARVIKGYEASTSQLVISRDQWKAAYDAEARRAAGLEIALAAQKTVSRSDKWIGRLQGFAIGIGVGYAGGRLH